jgi:hypothetical protein
MGRMGLLPVDSAVLATGLSLLLVIFFCRRSTRCRWNKRAKPAVVA